MINRLDYKEHMSYADELYEDFYNGLLLTNFKF